MRVSQVKRGPHGGMRGCCGLGFSCASSSGHVRGCCQRAAEPVGPLSDDATTELFAYIDLDRLNAHLSSMLLS